MLTIGLTGSIGSGKSTVRKLLSEKGAYVIDTDALGHQTYLPGTPVWIEIVSVWGGSVLTPDFSIDRKKLGRIVFGDQRQLQRLNELVQPVIKEEVIRQVDRCRNERMHQAVVVEAAGLVEAGWTDIVDEVWVVKADEEIVYKRLQENRGLTVSEIDLRLRRQMDVSEKETYAHVVIENNGDMNAVTRRLDTLWAERFGSMNIERRSF